MKKFMLVLMAWSLPLFADREFQEHILQVSGRGEVRIRATVADIRLGVEVEAKRSQEAQAQLSSRVNQLLNALRKEPVERLETALFTVTPEYSNTHPPEIKGFRGRAEIAFRSPLEHAGVVIENGMNSGATQVNGIELKASDSQVNEARQEALQKACESAMTASQTVFKTLSLKQREIASILVHPWDQSPTPIFRSRMAALAVSEESRGPQLEGEQTVDARVTLYIQFREQD
jgi:uncharacterized protein YggE